MSDTPGRAEALEILSRLSDGDRADLAKITDYRVGAALVLSYALADEHVDRTTYGQVKEYLSTFTHDDWIAMLKSLTPVAVALLPLL